MPKKTSKVTIKDIRKGHRIVCKHSVELGEYCDKCKMDTADQVFALLFCKSITEPVFDHYLERIGAMDNAVS